MIAVYAAGLVQGVCLVAFPASSTMLTNSQEFNFSNTLYGSLFIPQSLLSITAALLNARLCHTFGSKTVYLCGLIANMLSMILLAYSMCFMHQLHIAYPMLLVATGCLGLGFGLTVPTINAIAALLYPTSIDSVVLLLNALLGVGTALAPLFTAFFVAIGFFWGFPFLLVIAIIGLLFFSFPLPLPGKEQSSEGPLTFCRALPVQIWFFAAFALLYGIIETINGNWVSIYLSKHVKATEVMQSLALTAFWGMVTFGRVFFAAIEKVFCEQLIYRIAPFISAIAFILIALLPRGREYLAVFAFGFIGFGCATLLPLTISFGSKQLHTIAPCVPGMVISFYLLGYGIAAFGVGPLEDIAHINLRSVYMCGAGISLILGILSLFITKNKAKESS